MRFSTPFFLVLGWLVVPAASVLNLLLFQHAQGRIRGEKVVVLLIVCFFASGVHGCVSSLAWELWATGARLWARILCALFGVTSLLVFCWISGWPPHLGWVASFGLLGLWAVVLLLVPFY